MRSGAPSQGAGLLSTGSPAGGPDTASLRRPFEAVLGIPFTVGNTVEILRNGDRAFPAMLNAIAGATSSVDLLWFLWGHGEITDLFTGALADRARAGVRIRILLDGFGARGISHTQVRQLRAAGCQVAFFRPFRGGRVSTFNLRSHCRALICDEATAFTGGTGIDEAWTGDADSPAHWRDTAYRLRGPAVDGVRGAFARQWTQTSYQVLTTCDRFPEHDVAGSSAVQVVHATSRPGWNASGLVLLTLIELAQHRLRIVTPYVRLPGRLLAALHAAVQRGVQVQVLVSGPHVDRRLVALQSRDNHAALLDAGVDLWLYQPTVLHNKVITVDGASSFVGTTNFDIRSVTLNEQLGLVIDDVQLTGELDRQLDEDLADSRRLRPEQWRMRGIGERLVESAATLLGAPLQGLGTRGQSGPWP